ncbi:hypothetical protein THARTR1_00994 [Trichoderma harzianum]|uniref:Uncharacterized protein n=1 Tax=Trichoderma harzianum TaxID=5544 RepID=A0A2K0UNZ7_TRIHA|nr:hypothetical protein THARTR1_00994 [Trichoderma harzianum]
MYNAPSTKQGKTSRRHNLYGIGSRQETPIPATMGEGALGGVWTRMELAMDNGARKKPSSRGAADKQGRHRMDIQKQNVCM